MHNGALYMRVGGHCIVALTKYKSTKVSLTIDRVVNNLLIQDCLPVFNNASDGYKYTPGVGLSSPCYS